MIPSLPPRWRAARLGDCCDIVSGATPKRTVERYWNGSIRWATPKDISKTGAPVLLETPERITQEGLASCSARVLPVGSVLFSSRAPIGLTAIVGRELCTNQGFKSLIPHSNVATGYLYWLMRHYAPRIEARASGTTFKELSKAEMEAVEIPLPPLEEQHRLAAILDTADSLLRKRQEAIDLTEQLLRSTFLEMFAGSEVEQGKFTTVAGLAANRDAIRTGPFGSQLLRREFVDTGIAVLGIDNTTSNEFSWRQRRYITKEKYETLRRYTVHPGDVLITIMGTCGRCAIVPNDIPTAINTKHLCCITLDRQRCIPEFLHAYFLHHPTARRYLMRSAKGAIMDGLNMTIIKNLPVPVISLDRQQRYRTIATRIRNTAQKLAEHAREADSLLHSLTNKAFTGQL